MLIVDLIIIQFYLKAEEKYHNCGGKEKAAEYYQANKDVIKEKANNKYKNLSEEEKENINKHTIIHHFLILASLFGIFNTIHTIII